MSQTRYTVNQGDCISSIAFKHGFFWETIWNHPDNAELKRLRKDPNILMPGDTVFVPEKREKQESAATEQTHGFRKKGVPEKLRVVLRVEGEPRANAQCQVDVDGEISQAATDGQGRLTLSIPPGAKRCKVRLVDGGEEFDLDLGLLDPITEVTGVQARLASLGYDVEVTGQWDERSREAAREFQRRHDLAVTGEVDDQFRDALKEEFGA